MGRRPPSAPQVECVLAFPEPIKPLTSVRSTVLLASLGGIREDGHHDRYLQHLVPNDRDAIAGLIAGTWVPVVIAAAHYGACEALAFSKEEQIERGRRARSRIGGSVFGTALHSAKGAGATPWTLLPQLPRFLSRAYDAGGLGIFKLGPKDARIDLVCFSLCEIPYYRRALQGWLGGMLETLCSTLYLSEDRSPNGSDSVRYHAQWA